jgi:hypothetical protein
MGGRSICGRGPGGKIDEMSKPWASTGFCVSDKVHRSQIIILELGLDLKYRMHDFWLLKLTIRLGGERRSFLPFLCTITVESESIISRMVLLVSCFSRIIANRALKKRS